jgi:hypothetical protein
MSVLSREELKEKYRTAKKYRIRSAWAVVTGGGVFQFATEIIKGEVINYE